MVEMHHGLNEKGLIKAEACIVLTIKVLSDILCITLCECKASYLYMYILVGICNCMDTQISVK